MRKSLVKTSLLDIQMTTKSNFKEVFFYFFFLNFFRDTTIIRIVFIFQSDCRRCDFFRIENWKNVCLFLWRDIFWNSFIKIQPFHCVVVRCNYWWNHQKSGPSNLLISNDLVLSYLIKKFKTCCLLPGKAEANSSITMIIKIKPFISSRWNSSEFPRRLFQVICSF